jgi:hypothetical protein
MQYKEINFVQEDLISFVDKIDFGIILDDSDKLNHFLSFNSDNCWNWIAFKDRDGYGVFRRFRAHRVAYYFKYKVVKMDLLVGHICNNPSCVNPNHLNQITNQENMDYMVESGRSLGAEEHHRSTITSTIVNDILKEILKGCPRIDILRKYNISENQLFHILNGDCWIPESHEFCRLNSINLHDLKRKIFQSYHANRNNQNYQQDQIIFNILFDILYDNVKSKKEIMGKYNISRSTINQILNGKSRKNVSNQFELQYKIKLEILKNKIYNTA